MGNRVFVGNLSYSTNEDGLKQLFVDASVAVRSVRIVTDRATGRSRGFAFVELEDEAAVPGAIQSFDGAELDGRRLTVREAHDRPPPGRGGPRPGGGGFDRGPRPGGPGGGGGGFRGDRFGGPRSFDGGGPPAFGGPPPAEGGGGRDDRRGQRKKRSFDEDGEGRGRRGGGGRNGGGGRGGGRRGGYDEDY